MFVDYLTGNDFEGLITCYGQIYPVLEEKTIAHSTKGKKNFLTISALPDDSSPGMRRRAEKVTVYHI
jgi:hypothetical protein